MPLTKVDYSKTIIYKIQHRDNDELLYVGSTTDFTRRKYSHKWRCNNTNSKEYNMKIYKMMRDNGGFDCFNINIIKDFPCNNKQEALIEEDRCMREMKSNLNNNKAYRTPEQLFEYQKQYQKQYRQKNQDKVKQYYLENQDKNKEKYKQKVKCQCGCMIRKHNLARHQLTKKHKDYLLNMEQ